MVLSAEGPWESQTFAARRSAPSRPQENYKITVLNVTSLMLHWRTVQDVACDFLHVVETKVSPSEQAILDQSFKQKGWSTTWSPSPPGAGQAGMHGRSGGCLILAANGWELDEIIDVSLNNPKHCYVAGVYVNTDTGATSLQCCYYGHPSHKDQTHADFDILAELARHLQIDMCLAGDFNISDQDEENLPLEDFLCDTATAYATQTDTTMLHTYFAGRASSRLDRIYVSQPMLEHLCEVSPLDEVYVPGHCALQAVFQQRSIQHHVQVARPSLCRPDQPLQQPGFEEEAEVQWQELRQGGANIDELMDWWATTWERYLRARHGQPTIDHEPKDYKQQLGSNMPRQCDRECHSFSEDWQTI